MTQVVHNPSPSATLDFSVYDSTPVNGPHFDWQARDMSLNEENRPGPSKCPGPAKPKQTKSRNGCVTCKLKRLKCDEKKPGCDQCAKRNVPCGGYKKDFKWRPFEEQNVSVVAKHTSSSTSTLTAASEPACSVPSKPKPPSKAPLPRQSKSSINKSYPPTSTSLPERSRSSKPQRPVRSDPRHSRSPADHLSHSLPSEISPTPALGFDDFSDPSRTISPEDDSFDSPVPLGQPEVQDLSFLEQSPLNFPIAAAPPQYLEDFWMNNGWQVDGISNPAPDPSQLPVFQNFVQPHWWHGSALQSGYMPIPGTDLKPSRPEINFSASLQRPMPVPQARNVQLKKEAFEEDNDDDEDDVEEIMRPIEGLYSSQMAFQVPPEVFAYSNFPNPYWFSSPFETMLKEPRFSIESDEMVIARFERKTCGIMSVKDGPFENPWRTFVQPLMHQHRMIYNVVASMSCLQAHTKYPQLLGKGKDHFVQAFGALKAVGSNSLQVPYDVALAAMLGLAFAESWSSSQTTGTDYIKQSRPLMYHAIEECQRAPRGLEHLNRVKFLCRTWIYLDVLSRLTSTVDDDSNEFEQIAKIVSGPLEANVDPLMGVASTLFPIVGHVANLVRDVCKLPRNTPQLIAQGSNLKLELETWQPMSVPEIIHDETTTVDHNVQTALAYKWATLLYLHQAVPEIPMESCATLSDRALRCLAAVPMSSRTMIVQIYPLLAASCEANTSESREWASDRWDAMRLRLSIANVDRCVDVVQEAWRRRDVFARQVAHGSIEHSHSFPPSSAWLPGQHDRNFMPECPHYAEPYQSDRRHPRFDDPQVQKRVPPSSMSLSENDPLTGELRRELTVRGALHWVGVMKDYNWQVLLG